MSDYSEGKDSDSFGLNDDNLASDSTPTPTPGQHFGDWTSPLSLYDDPMQYINLSPHDFYTGPGEYATMEVPSGANQPPLKDQNLSPGQDIQQPETEYATMEVPSGANQPPLKDQNLSPGQDIQHATTQVQSGANAPPPLSPVENSSTGSKKRKSAAKGKGKIGRRNQGTFCIGESSNSKQPEKPTKKPDEYEESIKDKNVKESAKLLSDRLNRRKTRANALQNQLRRTYKQLDKSNPLRAKLEKQVEVLKKMVDEIQGVEIDFKEILKRPQENESEIDDVKKEFIKIADKSTKFIGDLDEAKRVLTEGKREVEKENKRQVKKMSKLENKKEQAKKETKEARQVLEEYEMLANERSQELEITRNVLNEERERQEKAMNIEPVFTNSMDYETEDLRQAFESVYPPDFQGILETDDPNPQQWTQDIFFEVPEEDRGQNAEENANVEVPTEEANGQQLRGFDEQIRGVDYRIYVLRAQRDVLVGMRANQHPQGQQLQVLDEQITDIDRRVEALVAQRDHLVGMRAILHARAL